MFQKLIEIVKSLRTPVTGCPWDLEQTHLSLRPYLLEESHEVLEALDKEDDILLCEELGDLLLQVVLHSQIASERGAFTIEDVVKNISEKMIRRHPHVFANTKVANTEEVLKNWETIKKAESITSNSSSAVFSLEKIPQTLSALVRAQRIGEKATKYNFDWNDLRSVREKVSEEISELDHEIENLLDSKKPLSAGRQSRRIEEEFGDVLFSLTQLARWCGLSAEDALRGTISKFILRFSKMEEMSNKPLEELSFEELDTLWNKSK